MINLTPVVKKGFAQYSNFKPSNQKNILTILHPFVHSYNRVLE